MSVVVVTGANSGIGRATAIHLAGQGHVVYGTVRSIERAAKLQAMAAEAGVEVKLVELDIADDESVRAGFAEVLAEAGGVRRAGQQRRHRRQRRRRGVPAVAVPGA